MPAQVALFERLYYASLALGLINSALQFDHFTRMASVAFVISVQLLVLVFLVLMIWLVARRRKNWARWLMLILFVVGTPLSIPTIWQTFQVNILWGGISVVQIILQAAAIYFVFTADARAWFRPSNAAATRPEVREFE